MSNENSLPAKQVENLKLRLNETWAAWDAEHEKRLTVEASLTSLRSRCEALEQEMRKAAGQAIALGGKQWEAPAHRAHVIAKYADKLKAITAQEG